MEDESVIDHVEMYRAQCAADAAQDLLDFGPPDDEENDIQANEEATVEYDVRERSQQISRAQNVYVYQNARYYFKHDKNKLAFRDTGSRLVTKYNDLQNTRNMVALEASRSGTKEVHVTGTKLFKSQAWRAGQELGVKVTGYEPTEEEVQAVNNYKVNTGVAKVVTEQKIKDQNSKERTIDMINDMLSTLNEEAWKMHDYDPNADYMEHTRQPAQPERSYDR